MCRELPTAFSLAQKFPLTDRTCSYSICHRPIHQKTQACGLGIDRALNMARSPGRKSCPTYTLIRSVTWRWWSAKADLSAVTRRLSCVTQWPADRCSCHRAGPDGNAGHRRRRYRVLVFLQRWCRDHDIRFKLFNPSRFVRERLEHTNAMSDFDIASLDEMMALLGRADSRYALAS